MMSYDLYLHPPDSRELQPAIVRKQLSFADINANWPQMPDPIVRMQHNRIVDELRELFPGFEEFTSYTSSNKHVELTFSNGIQVSLYTDSASITFPYWYQDEKSIRIILEHVRQCAVVIESVTGYVTEDGQIGRIIHFPDDIDDMVRIYLYTMDRIKKFILSPAKD